MDSLDVDDYQDYTVTQLKEELRMRYLPVTGLKNELILRITEDNEEKIKVGTMDTLKEEKIRRQSQSLEMEHMKKRLRELESQNQGTSHFKSQNTNEDVNLTAILSQIANTQQLMAQQISPTFQVFSTSDTSVAIPLFGGNRMENAKDWLRQVERISALANWSDNLTLVNASMRLRGPAQNWNTVVGKNYECWSEWKKAFAERFQMKMSFAEFIQYQSRRTLRHTETLTEYIYVKNAMLEKSPSLISDVDRVSLILEGIQDMRWSTPLAVHCCQEVEVLITHATALDNIRKVQRKVNERQETVSRYSDNRQKSTYIPRYNPGQDKMEEQTCFRCKKKGHVSYNCTIKSQDIQSNSNNNNNSRKLNYHNENPSTSKNLPYTPTKERKHDKQINCVQCNEPSVTLIPVKVNNNIEINALPDSGSVVTLMDRKVLPADQQAYPWQKGSYKVAGSTFTPIGWISARVEVGKIDYIMPQIAICENLPVDMIIGKDWQHAVYARIIHEPDGKICIITPTHTEYYPNVVSSDTPIACCINDKINDTKNITISSNDQEKVMNLVDKYSDIFKNDDNDIGEFQDVELEINLKHDNPIKCKPYRLPEPERAFLRKTVEQWIQQQVCRHSNSPYAAPMFVVQQPYHTTTPLRPVVDYSKTINPITITNVQPIDRMEDIISVISQFVYKFKLDIYHAYHNIKIKEADIHKTAVITQDHHIEFMRVMFGLVGGPSIMSKVINLTYGHLYEQGVRLYYDDISGGSNSIEQLLTVLEQVFIATRNKKLKLNKEKCIFITTELPLFGRIIGYKEEKPDPQRTAAVHKYKTLTSTSEIRSFLGFTNTFRKYIKNYALIAKPLNDTLKKDKTQTIDQKQQEKKKKIILTEEQQQSFETLKELITSPPILAYFQQNVETIVETDSSHQGMGACLLQIHDGQRKVIEYASRCLKDAETRYHINELEVTAVHWAIVSKFRIYLLGTKFTLITDSYTTAYVVNKSKMNRKFARYVVDLAPFDFIPIHRPGKQNCIADHLSRYPLEEICMTIVSGNYDKLRQAQSKDNFIKLICNKLTQEPTTNHLQQIQKKYKIDNRILIHINQEDLYNKEKIVIPETLRSSILKIAHDDSGHLDFKTTLTRIKQKYWWKSMTKDVKSYTKACLTCASTNRRTTLAYGTMGRRPIPNSPMDIISADHIVALPQTTSGNLYIIVHIDHATRYVMAKPTCSLSAKDVVNTIENDIINIYGPPLTYISDKAPCFMSQVTQKFFAKYGIEHMPTTPYTAQSNGLIERANATIISTLTKMVLEREKEWDMILPNILLSINTARQKTTGYSPFYLLHGYHPRIPPMEIQIGTVQEEIERTHQLDYLAEARKIAIHNIQEQHNINKSKFDLRRLDHKFQEQDYVLYEWIKPQDDKLTPKYKGPFQIKRKVGSVCYEIQDVKQPSKKKIVHVQFLKPLSKPPILDSFSAFSAFSDTKEMQPGCDNDNHDDDDADDDHHTIESADHQPDEDNTIRPNSNTYVTRRGRITSRPIKYDDDYSD